MPFLTTLVPAAAARAGLPLDVPPDPPVGLGSADWVVPVAIALVVLVGLAIAVVVRRRRS